MNKELYEMAVYSCASVYDSKTIDLGTTEFIVDKLIFGDEIINRIAIRGTDETKDWKKNLNLLSKKGVKKSAFDAAIEIAEHIKANGLLSLSLKTIVTGHSKGGAEAIAYHKVIKEIVPFYHSDWCVAFAPARCLRYWTDRKMENTTIFTDPDDPVSFFGRISFGHPICKHIKADDDHFGFKISDHDIDNWVRFVNNMEE